MLNINKICKKSYLYKLFKIIFMKSKIYTALWIFLTCAFTTTAQLKITEISYNPPESGTDSLEYIELYNSSSSVLNLKDFKFTKGVEHTFSEVLMEPDSYLVIAINAEAYFRNFGLEAIQWTKGALKNSGEIIAIANASGVEVISVDFKNVHPWPSAAEGTDGNGRSIELCNPEADPNDGNNWKVSENDLGFVINGKQVYGTPGAKNSISCGIDPDFTIEVSLGIYTPKDITIDVGQTVRWINVEGNNNINGDKSIFPNNPISFFNDNPSPELWTFDFKFDVAGFYEYQSDIYAPNSKGSITVLKEEVVDLYPLRSIPEVKGVNSEGIADSLGIKCALVGIVHTINFRTSGLQFVITDEQNKGFAIFSPSSTFGYDVTPGDAVEVKGHIDQFRGLSQLVLDSLKVLSVNNPLVNVKAVIEFEEEDESSYIQIQDVSFKDKTQWNPSGTGFNVEVTNGTIDYNVRIVNTSDAFSAPLPAGQTFNITGVLSQFAGNSAPFTGGYQLQPSYITDFQALTSVDNTGVLFEVSLAPNPVTHQVRIVSDIVPQKIVILDARGEELSVLPGKDLVEFSAMNPGVYFMKLYFGNTVITKKIIKL